MASKWLATSPPRPTDSKKEQRMFGAEKGTGDRLQGKGLCIGIVQARFNESITNALADARERVR